MTDDKMTDDNAPDCPGCRAVLEREPPPFDEDAARNLDAHEIRRRWPRRTDGCVLCGARMLRYASAMHYVMGDW